jgi:hypothetical protein
MNHPVLRGLLRQLSVRADTVLDLGYATLCPEFIDAHTYLSGEYNDDGTKAFVNRFRREVAEYAITAAVNARAVVEAEFTTVRDLGSDKLIDVGLRNSIGRGLVPGPRMLVSVSALLARGGHADRGGIRHDLLPGDGPAEGIAHGPDGFREAVRFQVKCGADVIKFCASGGVPNRLTRSRPARSSRSGWNERNRAARPQGAKPGFVPRGRTTDHGPIAAPPRRLRGRRQLSLSVGFLLVTSLG